MATTDECKQEPGRVMPVIDRGTCEGHADCVVICPYEVFELAHVPVADRSGLSTLSKIKGFIHGWKQAYAVNADACRACGLCVQTCPEKAIRLVRQDSIR